MIKALIADDTNIMRTIIKSNLKKLNPVINIVEVCNGKDALSHILNNDINLLFLDINMPELDGLNVANYIKQKDMNILTIIISSELDLEKEALLKEMGIRHFLGKPFDKTKFVEIVHPFIKSFKNENS